jgi:hypothetical protein
MVKIIMMTKDINKTIARWMLCIGIAFATTSCILSVSEVGHSGTVRLTLNVPGRSIPTLSSRAMTDEQESAMDNLYVLAFPTSGNNAGTLGYVKAATPVSGSSTAFEVELPTGTYDFMVVANAKDVISGAGFTLNSTTKAQVVAAMTVSTSSSNSYKWAGTTIPLWGYTLTSVTVTDNSPTGNPIEVDMHRMLVRIDVALSTLAASGTVGGTGNDNFALTEVYLVNYNTVGQIAPNYTDPTVWNPTGGAVNAGKGIAIAPSLPAAVGKQTGMETSSPWAPAQKYTSGDGLTASTLEKAIYTFEADNGTASTHGTNPCVIVGGSYEGGATTYYRVDFIAKGGTSAAPTYTYLDLLRNHRYTLAIGKVSGAGYDTPKDAFDARSFNMEVDVMEWEESDMNEVGFDEQYSLAISQNEYEFSFEGGSQSLTVHTDFPDGWAATVCDAKGTPVTGVANWITVPETGATGAGTVNIAAPLYSDTSADRTLYIHITAGRMTLKVEVTQRAPLSPLAGILAPPGVIGYIRGTDILTLKGSQEYAANADIAQYAADNFGGLSDQTVYLAYFKFGSLIAISSDTSDTAAPYLEPEDIITGPSEWSGYRALKATPTWAGIPVYQDTDNTAGKFNVSAPTYHNAENIALGKGDPCMYYSDYFGTGYKLPTGNPYNGYSDTSMGAWQVASGDIPAGRFSSVAGEEGMFYSATGYRSVSDGTMYYQGINGYYWSSTVLGGTSGYILNFNNSSVGPFDTSLHTNGHSVRCIIPLPTIAVSPATYKCEATGGSKEFTVTTTEFAGTPSITLSGYDNGSWLGTPTLTGDTLKVTVAANPSSNARTGYIILTAGTANAMITITQNPTPDDWTDGGNQGVIVGN